MSINQKDNMNAYGEHGGYEPQILSWPWSSVHHVIVVDIKVFKTHPNQVKFSVRTSLSELDHAKTEQYQQNFLKNILKK